MTTEETTAVEFAAIGEEVESPGAIPTVEEVAADLGANDPEPDREVDPDGWRKWNERRRKRRQRATATVEKLIAEREASGAMAPADASAARESAKRTAGRRAKRSPRAQVAPQAPIAGPSEQDRIRSAVELCKVVARGTLALGDATGLIKSQESDADTLGDVWGPVAEPYLREEGGNTPLIAAVIVTGQVLIVRYLDARAERARVLPAGYTEPAPRAPEKPEPAPVSAGLAPRDEFAQPGAVPGYTPVEDAQ